MFRVYLLWNLTMIKVIYTGTKITFLFYFFCLKDRSVHILLPHHSTRTHNTCRHTGLAIQCWLQHHALAGFLRDAAAAGACGVASSQPGLAAHAGIGALACGLAGRRGRAHGGAELPFRAGHTPTARDARR
uniref:Uncharacterized protein n=1 Tax=Aegilops tauschii subsp. strangulata TaxID=200361 RepID=A0A453QIM5_AEGTS